MKVNIITLIIAIFFLVILVVISMDSLFFILLLTTKQSLPWLNHVVFWPSLAILIWFNRSFFYWICPLIAEALGDKDYETEEVSK